MTKLSRTGMICLISLTLTGCSAIGNSSATIDNSRSSEGQGSTATEASPSVNEFPLGVTTSLLADGGPVLMTFDRIVATDQLHQKHAAPGTTFLILHYRTILKPSKWGAHTESLRTALFAISNSENVSYSVDDSSVLSLQMDQRFIAPDETVECMTSELHPGVEKSLLLSSRFQLTNLNSTRSFWYQIS